jgi:hypothetical protein
MDRRAQLWRWSVVVVFAAESLFFVGWIPDDAFISFRYADNLAEGSGLVFNPGERVEGMSNPLWTVLLAAITAVGGSAAGAAVILSLVCALAAVALTLRLFEVVGGGPGRHLVPKALLSVALVVSMPMAFYATSGMETHAELSLLLAGVVLHLQARSHGGDPRRLAASQLAFLGVALLRPEGIMFLLVGCVLTAYTLRGRRGAILVATPLVIYVVLCAVKAAYYGAVLPNTYLAKPGAQIGYLAPLWRGVRSLVRFHIVSGFVLLLPFCVVAFADRRRRYACALISAVVTAQLAFIVLVGGDVLRFNRFTVPFFPFAIALALIGLIHVVSTQRTRPRRMLLAAAVAGVAIMAVLNVGRAVLAHQKRCEHDWMHAHVHRYVGRFLRDALPAGSAVVTNEVGAIAYESGLVTHDMIGLTDATVGALVYESYRRFGDAGTPWSAPLIADYLLSRNADCVIVPSYDPLDSPDGAMHPIWAAVHGHEGMAADYRCWFGLRIHEGKYWYLFLRKDVDESATGPHIIEVPPGLWCAAVVDCPTASGPTR